MYRDPLSIPRWVITRMDKEKHSCSTQYVYQGVPYYWTQFVFFCNFSGSGAPTEELFTIFQQPWKFATL